jgi:peptidyl-prolyl cis-trans isomerase B (cyclophilin B)
MSNPFVLLETSEGDILIELFADKAPVTVENFLRYVDEGHYDDTIFHRVIKNFMVQGGGLTLNMKPKPTREPIANEAVNGLANKAGTVAMARAAGKDSATAQFFINVVDNASLDHKDDTDAGFGYAVFGQVAEGMDVALKISKKRTRHFQGHDDVPVDPVALISSQRFEI